MSSDAISHGLPKIFLLVVQRQFAVVMRSAYQLSVIMCFLGKEDSTYDTNNAGPTRCSFWTYRSLWALPASESYIAQ